ncbi:MAG: VOC family protein [Gemmatimonadota bacterium]
MSKAKKRGAKRGAAKKGVTKGAAKRGAAGRGATKKAKRPAAKKAARATSRKAAPSKKKGAPQAHSPRRDPETLRIRNVSAGLTVGDLGKSLAWYRDVLGFIVEEEWKRDDKVTGVGLLAGSARLFISQDDFAKGRDRKKGEGFRLHLATGQDVDGIAARIKARGGKLESEPAEMPWGTRAFALVDPDGFKLTISSEG